MTALQQAPKEHCDHECVCTNYGLIPLWQKNHDNGSCNIAYCEHDTRSRPHPAPARSGCGGCRKETEHLECPMPGRCDQMKCPICCEGSDFPTLPEEIKKYEQAAARQAREDVLSLMGDYLAEHIYTCRGISCVDSMKMAKYIGSLRSTQHPGQ